MHKSGDDLESKFNDPMCQRGGENVEVFPISNSYKSIFPYTPPPPLSPPLPLSLTPVKQDVEI